tara:strand:+ start:21513 stop:21899 length:387 start_codon:yes stop_codon:yes gene_type:complete
MSLEVFDFPYHKVSYSYRERSSRITLGNDWEYVTKPSTPVSRLFKLSFEAMKSFETPQTLSPMERRYSIDHLDDFYQRHELWSEFLYNHHRFGNVVVRFDSPLQVPEGYTEGDGVSLPFIVTLREIPL